MQFQMRIQQFLSILFLSSFLYTNQVDAAVFHANASGDWEEPSTWLEPGVPGLGDDVVIDGFEVTFGSHAASANVTVNRIDIYNSNTSALKIKGNYQLTVTGDVTATAASANNLKIEVMDNATFSVGGNLTFDRPASNSFDNIFQLHIKGFSNVNVGVDFMFNYNGSSALEGDAEILMEDDADLTVTGATTFSSTGGEAFMMDIKGTAQATLTAALNMTMNIGSKNLYVQTSSPTAILQLNSNANMTNNGGIGNFFLGTDVLGGSITINGDANITSNMGGAQAYMEAAGANSLINVRGNINLNGVANGNVKAIAWQNAKLSLGGTINRPNDYGQLVMDGTGTFELSGTTNAQIIPSTAPQGTATDSLFITNITFNNTSGEPITLQGPMVVDEYMTLTAGVIQTSDVNTLTIKHQAGIDAGSPSSYIQGPIIKEGSTNGASFVFPTGLNGVYAPIEISAVANASSTYIAQREGDPPPFGNLNMGILDISDTHHWTLNKLPGSEDVKVTLHWDDISADGYTNMDDLLVVALIDDTWTSYGNSATGGNTFTDAAGFVASKLDGDPPPFGNLSYTIGTAAEEPLPVELLSFHAVLDGDEIQLQWQTVSETNSDYFVVERSNDGVNFELHAMLMSQGEGADFRTYNTVDAQPNYGANFYRLKMVEKDGAFEYSHIEVVKFNMKSDVNIYPNPVTSESFTIGGTELGDSEAKLEVFDRSGKRLFDSNVNFVFGTLHIQSEQLNIYYPGAYMIRVTFGSETRMLKLIKIE